MPASVAKKSFEVDDKGYASLPAGPGLGVEIDETMFEKVNADPRRKFKWPTLTLPDGAVRDY
jgi:L-alanine-DL-glutamate epimerase-like enolase superfamily enzyme